MSKDQKTMDFSETVSMSMSMKCEKTDKGIKLIDFEIKGQSEIPTMLSSLANQMTITDGKKSVAEVLLMIAQNIYPKVIDDKVSEIVDKLNEDAE